MVADDNRPHLASACVSTESDRKPTTQPSTPCRTGSPAPPDPTGLVCPGATAYCCSTSTVFESMERDAGPRRKIPATRFCRALSLMQPWRGRCNRTRQATEHVAFCHLVAPGLTRPPAVAAAVTPLRDVNGLWKQNGKVPLFRPGRGSPATR